jgi:hypothetical protein
VPAGDKSSSQNFDAVLTLSTMGSTPNASSTMSSTNYQVNISFVGISQ